MIAAACDLLADRVIATRDQRPHDSRRYHQAVRAGKITDHRRAGHRHLTANPELTPEALADMLEPPRPTPAPGVVDRLNPATPEQRARQQRAARRQATDGMRRATALARKPLPTDGAQRVAELRRQLEAVQEHLPADRPALPTDHTNAGAALRALRRLQEDR